MFKNNVLTIDGWQTGVADSPTVGFGSINNCEIFETPGVLKIAPASTNMYATDHPDSLPIAFAEDNLGNQYFLSTNGTLYKNSGGALFSLQTGLNGANDILFYRDYVWVSYGNVGSGSIGVYGPVSSGPSWFGTVATGLTLTGRKCFVVCQDDKIYISNGTNVKYMSGFTPTASGVAPTVTLSTTGWSLPGSYTNGAGTVTSTQLITTMVEYGRNLLVGTDAGNIYQWDRADTQLTDVPFKFSAGRINQMITKENRIYITSGNRGNVYIGDGTNFQKMVKLKWRQRRPYTSTTSLKANAIALSPNGTLLIGTSTETDSFPSNSMHGIHEVLLQPDKNGNYPTCFKNTISTGNTGTSQALYIGFIATSNGTTYIGWQDGTTYGFDQVGGTGGIYTSATAETPLYQIGTRLDQITLNHLEFKLTTPLISGQSISLQFRKNLTDTYDTARTFSYSSQGGLDIFTTSARLTNIDQLQAKITLTSPAGVGDTNLELISITLW